MSPLHVWSKVCLAPFYVWSTVCIFFYTWIGAMQTLLRRGAMQTLLCTWSGDMIEGTKKKLKLPFGKFSYFCHYYLYPNSLYDLCEHFR